MHKLKAAQRRAEQKESARPAIPAPKKKENKEKEKMKEVELEGQKGPGAVTEFITGIGQLIGRWICSTRFVSLLCFIFGLVGRYFHVFDPLMQDFQGSFPSYLCGPTIIFVSGAVYVMVFNAAHAHSLPQVLTMVCCCGVLAGAIIEEQVEDLVKAQIFQYQPEDFAYLSLACAALSFGVSAIDYRMNGSMKMLLFRAMLCAAPVWLLAVYNILPLSMVALQTGLLCSFTLAVGIVDFFVAELRTHIPAFTSVFPAVYIGCVVQAFAMVALTTYFTSLRSARFSDSWFSFSWMVPAGPPLCVFTLVCHLIHWTCEKISGPGPHNAKYTCGAVMVAWSAAALLSAFGWKGLFGREFLGAPLDMAHIAVDFVRKAIGW